MCTLYNRITDLCKSKGVSGSRMCLDLGLSKSTLSDIKNGRKKGISTVTAQKMASYLNVSVDYLLGEEETQETKKDPEERSLSEVDKELLEMLRQIPEEQKKLFLEMGRVFVSNQRKDP